MLRRGAPKLDENGKPMRDARRKVIYEPYRIKVLNTINFKKSMKYNPFAYIRSEKDILKLVNVIIANTKGDGEKSSEDFWVKAERLLYCALIGYIWYEAEPEEKNFLTLLELINASEAREDDEEFQSPVDILFAKLEKEHPDHFAVKQYRKFKLAAGVVWSELNHAPILPEHINCQGCRMDGAKTVYCESLCGIRQCALQKGVTTCGDCPELESCQMVGAIHSNNPAALENLKG